MPIAIIGSNGQLAQAFLRRLGDRAVGFTREQADLTKPETIRSALTSLRPTAVINCAAYNWVDHSETDVVAPFAVNAWGVRDLAVVCRDLGATLIHYSTNYVFGGDEARRSPYLEADLPAPTGVYGASKVAGEHLALAAWPRTFVIRTCGLFGVGAPGTARNFVELMLHLAREGRPIRVVNDQICSPTKTDDLVDASLRLLDSDRHGIYHLTSAGECTWHDLARTAFELQGISADLRGVTSADFGAAARRPRYSVLANAAYARLGHPPIRDWRAALAEYLAEQTEPA